MMGMDDKDGDGQWDGWGITGMCHQLQGTFKACRVASAPGHPDA